MRGEARGKSGRKLPLDAKYSAFGTAALQDNRSVAGHGRPTGRLLGGDAERSLWRSGELQDPVDVLGDRGKEPEVRKRVCGSDFRDRVRVELGRGA